MNNLFRAKTTKKENENHGFNNVWVYGDLLTNKGVHYIHPQNNVFRLDGELAKILIAHEVQSETIGRFLGLLDKNGKKIFEGDIVKIYWRDNVLTMGDIRYDKNSCRFVLAEDFAYPYGFDNTTPLEVIGNIYDNPEFLEKFK